MFVTEEIGFNIYTAVNKDFLAFNSIIDRGGIFSLETDKLELQSVSCVD